MQYKQKELDYKYTNKLVYKNSMLYLNNAPFLKNPRIIYRANYMYVNITYLDHFKDSFLTHNFFLKSQYKAYKRFICEKCFSELTAEKDKCFPYIDIRFYLNQELDTLKPCNEIIMKKACL